MLKIKDSVDLKELEKFGFEYEKEHGIFPNRYIYVDNRCDQLVQIDADDRTILVEDISEDYFVGALVDNALNALYDLIKADMVEKVSDKK